MWETNGETSGRQMSMTCRTKGPRRALEHPECGRQMGDKWETNEYDEWALQRPECGRQMGDKWEKNEYDV